MPLISALAFSLGSYGFRGGGGVILISKSIFTATSVFTVPDGVEEVDFLIVAGGGGARGGGGGAGGVRLGSGFPVDAGEDYTITVGGGGATASPRAGNGVGSSIQGGSPTVVHLGANGGGGGGANGQFGHAGGSGGGNGQDKTTDTSGFGTGLTLTSANGHASFPSVNFTYTVQGFNGGQGYSSPYGAGNGGGGAGEHGRGGGQGAGAPTNGAPGGGVDGLGGFGGNGGNGIATTILGSSQFYGGGGGGGCNTNTSSPDMFDFACFGGHGGGGNGARNASAGGSSGDANTGGGGGGGEYDNQGGGGSGGSGIVILSYSLSTQYQIFQFAGSTTWIVPEGVTEIDYLIVAGGGAGNKYSTAPGKNAGVAGSGGGGARIGTGLPVTPGSTFSIEVGAGGSGPSVPGGSSYVSVTSGSGSSIEGSFAAPISPIQHIGSNGGGVGGTHFYTAPGTGPSNINGTDGGCSGGGSSNGSVDEGTAGSSLALNPTNGHSYPIAGEDISRGSAVQGFDGAPGYNWSGSRGGGGGGGAGGDGVRFRPRGGNGGVALITDISGFSRGYAGGGGGSYHQEAGTNSLFVPPNSGLGGSTNNPLLKGGGMDAFGNTAPAPAGGGSSNAPINRNAPVNTGGGSAGVNGPSNGGSGVVIIKYTL